MRTVRARGRKDLLDQVISKLKMSRPKSDDITFDVARSTDKVLSEVKYILTTGIRPLDAYTGGLPFGRLVEVYGVEGCGKTATVMRSCVRGQQRFIYERSRDAEGKPIYDRVEDCEVVILYIDNEQSIDDDSKLVIDGVEIDAAIGRCDTTDQMFKMIDLTIDQVDSVAAKAAKEAEKAKKKPTPYFVIVIVDTIASTSSKEELTQAWDAVDYTRQPQQLRRGFRKLMRKINRRNVLWICTNQISERYDKARSRGNSGGLPRPDDFSTFGGRALRFFASLRLFMFKINDNYRLNKKSVGGPSGFSGGFVTVKNRQCKPMREGRFVLLYEDGLSDIFSILETMTKVKTVVRSETGTYGFRFRATGVEPTSFPDLKGNENPSITSLDQWPAFYQAHKADLDSLWERSVALAFSDDTLKKTEDDDDDDDLLLEDDDDDVTGTDPDA